MKTELEKYNACSEAVDFREQYKNFQEAWENCPRGDWMLWIASKVGVNKRKLTLAKALCAETVKHLMKDDRSKNAIVVAKRYGRYRANDEELSAAAAASDAASAASAASAAAADAAAAAADADADADVAASDAADAASAASAASASDARKQNRLATAKICRKILSKDVLRLINK